MRCQSQVAFMQPHRTEGQMNRGNVYKSCFPHSSIKDAAGSLSRQRRNNMFAVPSRPLRVSLAKCPGPAAGQASLSDLCSSLSDIMSVLTISWRHAIRGQFRVSADPRTHSCCLTTAGANPRFL